MPVVQITLTQGRSPQAIRSMISKVTDAIVEAEVAPKPTIRVLVTEIPREHFAAGDVTIAERLASQDASAERSSS
ncbi:MULTISPECIES: tautomerase family protein [Janibacter]|mgnify:CR=1 FL=1|jgi:4-oxalocrotonate tautomerase|uniref:tautomerase family protein n=1 Tax=Janibacter TaxID=53457 RepID=UPI00174E5EC3|nr:tautomerase family protein [Janibacter melonis]